MIFEFTYNNIDEQWKVVEKGQYKGTAFGSGHTAKEAYENAEWAIKDSDKFDCWDCDECNICGGVHDA